MSFSCSLTGLSPCSQTKRLNSTSSKQGFTDNMKALSVKPHCIQQSLSFPVKFQPYSSQISSDICPRLSCFRLSVSSFPIISCYRTPQAHVIKQFHKSFLNFFPDKLAVLLLGSLLFAGRFSGRPALALLTDAPKSSSAKHVEEKRETQMGKDVDEERYEKMLEQNPRDTEALKVLMYGKMRKGKTRKAVEYVERLIDVEPDEVEWRLLQALSYELMGQLTKAKKLFKEILEERPLLLRALHGLALVMHKNHEGPAVFDMLNKALELARHEQRVTEERDIQILIAQMHVVKGDLEGGLKLFKTLVNENHGDLEGGLKQFQKLIDQNPRDFRPYLCQGIIYSLLDRKKEADEQFQIYQSLIPDEFPQREFIDDVILAAKTESQEQLEEKFESELSYRK